MFQPLGISEKCWEALGSEEIGIGRQYPFRNLSYVLVEVEVELVLLAPLPS